MKVAGDRIGRFRVERFLGAGGIAEVYQVRHELLDTSHALKLLPIARRGLAKRLIQEGRIQAQLQHPNVVSVTDVVEERGQIGLVMEYVEGTSLEELLREGGAMDFDEAMDLFGQILSGVAAAHMAGVLHRDLKPSNVLLAADGDAVVAKVADFGIAKLASEEATLKATQGGTPMGTPGYMAPEQITDSAIADQRSDVFALGAILYEMLSGQRAFRGANLRELLENTLTGRYIPLRRLNPKVAEYLEQVTARAMMVSPDDRFQNCMEMARALHIESEIVPPKALPAQVGEAPVLPPPVTRAELSRSTGGTIPPTDRRGAPPPPPPRRSAAPPPPPPRQAPQAQADEDDDDARPTLMPEDLQEMDAPPLRRTLSLDAPNDGAVNTLPIDEITDEVKVGGPSGLGNLTGLDRAYDPEEAIPTFHARGISAAEDTWTTDDEENAEFGLPNAEAVPTARVESVKGRRQSFTVPNNRGAEAPTPAPKPAAARPTPPSQPLSLPPRAVVPPVRDDVMPTLTDPSGPQRRLNTSGSGVGERRSMNTTGGSAIETIVREAQANAAKEKAPAVDDATLSRLLRSFGLLMIPVFFVVVAVGVMGGLGASQLKQDAETTAKAYAQVESAIAQQRSAMDTLNSYGVDVSALTKPLQNVSEALASGRRRQDRRGQRGVQRRAADALGG
ncbi:MAG: serine/threonine protein kinase [Deltaproteobacteria bacterium]|nr:serine/threonine protein kinase [Deltaproteobacteria bacterium]